MRKAVLADEGVTRVSLEARVFFAEDSVGQSVIPLPPWRRDRLLNGWEKVRIGYGASRRLTREGIIGLGLLTGSLRDRRKTRGAHRGGGITRGILPAAQEGRRLGAASGSLVVIPLEKGLC